MLLGAIHTWQQWCKHFMSSEMSYMVTNGIYSHLTTKTKSSIVIVVNGVNFYQQFLSPSVNGPLNFICSFTWGKIPIQVLSVWQNDSLHQTCIHPSERVIRVWFMHNNQSSGGNHFDAITMLSWYVPDNPLISPSKFPQLMSEGYDESNQNKNWRRLSLKKN